MDEQEQTSQNDQDQEKQEKKEKPQVKKEEIIKLMQTQADFSLGAEKGRAKINLSNLSLSVLPGNGNAIDLPLRDIINFSASEYKIKISIFSGELLLENLGYDYESFVNALSKTRNEQLIKDLLMDEKLIKGNIKGQFSGSGQQGECEVKVYETALVIVPLAGDLVRVPYSQITDISDQDYKFFVNLIDGSKIEISMLGEKFDLLKKEMSEALNAISLKAQQALKEMMPEVDPLLIRQTANLMKDGKAVTKQEIIAIAPQVWDLLEAKLKDFNIDAEFNFLKELSESQNLSIGIKKGLMGSLTGDYIWFLIPIPKNNLIAMEATSQTGSGRATYFFRITKRDGFKSASQQEIEKKIQEVLLQINSCMLAINFRREPIYLPDEKLKDGKYQKYRTAIAKIPELKNLRDLFVGRLTHRSDEQWQTDAKDLMSFNLSATNDQEKWAKSSLEEEEEADSEKAESLPEAEENNQQNNEN